MFMFGWRRWVTNGHMSGAFPSNNTSSNRENNDHLGLSFEDWYETNRCRDGIDCILSHQIRILSHFAIWIFLLGPVVGPLPAFPCQVAGAPPSPGNGWAKQQDFQALQAACKKLAGPRNTCKSQLGQLLQWMDNGQGARSIQAYVVRFQRIEMRWMPSLKHFYPFRTSSNSTCLCLMSAHPGKAL